MALSKKQREILKSKYGDKCAYCGCDLPDKGWHADHIEPVLRISERDTSPKYSGMFKLKATGGFTYEERECVENYNPSCAPCNLFKSTFSVEQLRYQISQQIIRARNTSVNFRVAERFGLLQTVDKPVQFWFEVYDEEVLSDDK